VARLLRCALDNSTCDTMMLRMLLKSWAIPPASVPRLPSSRGAADIVDPPAVSARDSAPSVCCGDESAIFRPRTRAYADHIDGDPSFARFLYSMQDALREAGRTRIGHSRRGHLAALDHARRLRDPSSRE
jgi:hypothetical protein